MICLNALKKVFFVFGFVPFYSLTLSSSISMEDSRLLEGKARPSVKLTSPHSTLMESRSISLLRLPANSSPRNGKENSERTEDHSQMPPKISSPKISLSLPSSPKSSPRRSPRPRSISSTNPHYLDESQPSLALSFIRRVSPRIIRPNDAISERFEQMGIAEGSETTDLWCKKFYQQFKGKSGEHVLTSRLDWKSDTKTPMLDQLLEFPIMDYLKEEDIKKIEEANLELIGSLVIFSIEELNDQGHPEFKILCNSACTIYSHLLTTLSQKLNTTGAEITKEECAYHIAKYYTLLNSFPQAWPYLIKGISFLDHNDEEEQKWVNRLKDGYLAHLMNEQATVPDRCEELFYIADFSRTMKAQRIETIDNPPDTEIITIFLEGAKDLYRKNITPQQKIDRINKLPLEALFPLAELAYRSSQRTYEEAKTLLTVSRDCFTVLGQNRVTYPIMPFLDELLESLDTKDSREVKVLKADIFSHVGTDAWEINKGEKAKKLCFEAVKLLYHVKPQRSCPNWNIDLLALILESTLPATDLLQWDIVVKGICAHLVNKNYVSTVYLSVLHSYMAREMWVAASHLTPSISKVIPSSHEKELKELTEAIQKGLTVSQEYKRHLIKAFSEIVPSIIEHKKFNNRKINQVGEKWIQAGVITQEQWLILLNKDNLSCVNQFFITMRDESKGDFLNLEQTAYTCKIYELFTLGSPPDFI